MTAIFTCFRWGTSRLQSDTKWGFLLNSGHSGLSAVPVRGTRGTGLWGPGTHHSTLPIITSVLLCGAPGSLAENRLPHLHKKPFVLFQGLLNSWKYSDHYCPYANNDFSCLYALHKISMEGCWGFFANSTVRSCVSLWQGLEEWPTVLSAGVLRLLHVQSLTAPWAWYDIGSCSLRWWVTHSSLPQSEGGYRVFSCKSDVRWGFLGKKLKVARGSVRSGSTDLPSYKQ